LSVSAVSPDAWPALAYEQVVWEPTDAVPASRSARRRHRGPYEAAVPPSIAGRAVTLAPEAAALVDDAAAEVARFDADMGHEIAPFASVLLRSESAASSKIENLTASARAIAVAELTPDAPGNGRLIVANVHAMTAAISLAGRIDADAVLQMHRALLGDANPSAAGRWRDEQVWIGGSDYGPHGADYVAPHHSRVEAAIDDLVRFIDREDVPILAHAALAHAQFETIHPFTDGNGRTGRALLHAQLWNKGLTRHVTVPVSAGFLTDTDAYFAALTSYRAGDPIPIVERLAAATFAALANGRRLVEDLRAIRGHWGQRVRARRGANAWKIADLLLRHPVINVRLVADETGIAPSNAYGPLQPLVDAAVLVEFTDKKRNKMWRAPEILEALDAFATRAGRRRRH